jgi:hypothetical protein
VPRSRSSKSIRSPFPIYEGPRSVKGELVDGHLTLPGGVDTALGKNTRPKG